MTTWTFQEAQTVLDKLVYLPSSEESQPDFQTDQGVSYLNGRAAL